MNILKYIVHKGSITIDGISLTVAYVDDSCFKVSIIPHTARETTLLNKKVGDTVNLECDLIGKYVEKLLGLNIDKNNNHENLISEEFLRNNGFL
ncbi:riboflavin synthase subunit alpha [[Clostridium] sordellii]|nr:riboflavin synthase subunit alpha [[Clostridium] sordellii] [Paeniclostridium sordellii]